MRRSPTPLLLAALVTLAACTTSRSGADTARANAALDDAEVLHVFITANRGEVMSNQPFVDELQHDEAQAFAREMVAVHSTVLGRAEALRLVPRNNPISEGMNRMVQERVRQLERMDGAELDRAYVETQVMLHQQTLETLDRMLIPNARNGELRALLVQSRPEVQRHLEHAQQLQRQVGGHDASHGGHGGQ